MRYQVQLLKVLESVKIGCWRGSVQELRRVLGNSKNPQHCAGTRGDFGVPWVEELTTPIPQLRTFLWPSL